jgi:hypothetical protein
MEASMPDVDEPQVTPAPERAPEREHRHEHKHEDSEMGITEQLDKININMPGADGGGMGGIGAMLAAMMANKDSGGGMKEMWPLLLLFLLRRGGLEGDVGAVAAATGIDRCEITAVLSKLGDLQAAGPLSTAQIQAFLESQTGQIANQISQQTLFISQGFANTGDKIQNGNTAILAAGQLNTASILTAIQGVKDQATTFEMNNLQRQLTVADSALLDERHSRRSRDVEVNVTQQVNQQQQQAQFQAQIGGVLAAVQALMVQNSRQAQDIVNLGTMTASGTQAAANTQVR